MAATFNLLRGRDLIWNYVVNNYLLGEDYAAVRPALLERRHDQLAGRWHRDYLPTSIATTSWSATGGLEVDGTPIDLDPVETPDLYPGRARGSYRAARKRVEDHRTFRRPEAVRARRQRAISPGWSTRRRRRNINIGPTTPRRPNARPFLAGATEHKGSWWPDWLGWLKQQDGATVKAEGPRVPGKGKHKAVEDAPGSYVKAR